MHLKWRGSVAVSSKEIGKLVPLSVWIHLMDNGQAFIRYSINIAEECVLCSSKTFTRAFCNTH